MLPESITLVPAQPDSVENEVPPNPQIPNPECLITVSITLVVSSYVSLSLSFPHISPVMHKKGLQGTPDAVPAQPDSVENEVPSPTPLGRVLL